MKVIAGSVMLFLLKINVILTFIYCLAQTRDKNSVTPEQMRKLADELGKSSIAITNGFARQVLSRISKCA